MGCSSRFALQSAGISQVRDLSITDPSFTKPFPFHLYEEAALSIIHGGMKKPTNAPSRYRDPERSPRDVSAINRLRQERRAESVLLRAIEQ